MRSSLVVAALALTPVVATSQSLVPPPPAAPSAPATRRGPTLGFAADLSFELGGDDFLEVAFTDGGSQTLRAGQGGTLAIGGIVRPSATSPVSLRGTIGVKYVTTAADNANIRFTRIPMELVGSYHFPGGMRVGAGAVVHVNNRLNGDGFVPDATFDPATGATVELGYKLVALTYTALTYKAPGGQSLDAGSVGVQVLWTPRRTRR